MRRLVSGLLLALAACPADPDTGTDATTTQPSTPSTSGLGATTTSGPTSSTDPTTGPDVTSAPTSTSSSGTTVEPGTTGDTTTTGSTGSTGDGALEISIKDVIVFADCPPNPEDDPIVATWVVVYDNSTNPAPASAELIDVDFGFNESDPPISLPWTADPTVSGPIGAGEVVEQPMTKVMGASFPFCNVCGKDYHVGWIFDVTGEQVYIQFDDNLVCEP
jgi:hypothetical protein